MTPSVFPTPAQERAFVQSVVYASLFDYPLSITQLREGLIGEIADEDTLARWYAASPRLQATVEHRDGYYFPRGRDDLLEIRRYREALSRRLLHELASPLRFLTRMPFVRMVALSGSLAHLNAESDADLDLFVITKAGRVWSVTVTTLAIARLLGWRARLCLNYVVSERALMVEPADLFSANQIIHLQPVHGVGIYRRFIEANRFIKRFYPNFSPRLGTVGGPGFSAPVEGPVPSTLEWSAAGSSTRTVIDHLLDWTIAPLYERVCRALYGYHLRSRAHTWRSRDQVRLENECLKLHTSSHRREVMERFERALDEAAAAADVAMVTLEESSRVRAAR
jgi:hypothetical protein